MIHQLPQVLLTYATRRSLWLVLACGLLFVGPSVALAHLLELEPTHRAGFLLFSVCATDFIVCFVIVTQAKWQFCDSRSCLLPGFAVPHVLPLVTMAVLGLGLYPVIVGARIGTPWGLAACAIGIASCMIWSMHGDDRLLALLALMQCFVLISPPVREFWTSTHYAAIHVPIVVAGWAALFLWLRRLTSMREEDSDYLVPLQAQQGSPTRRERSHADRVIARMVVRNSWQRLTCDWWHDRLANVRERTARGRQWLLRYGYSPTPVEYSAIPIAAGYFFILFTIFHWREFPSKGPGISALVIPMAFPAMTTSGLLAIRRTRMAFELLLPLTRRQYFDGVLAAAARSAFISWIPTHGAIIALIFFTTSIRVDPPFVVDLTALSLGFHVCAFSIMARIAQIPSGFLRQILPFASLFPAMMVLGIGMASLETGYSLAAWIIALALAAFGLLYLRRVRDRWFNLELA
jgi:hypothetical protein